MKMLLLRCWTRREAIASAALWTPIRSNAASAHTQQQTTAYHQQQLTPPLPQPAPHDNVFAKILNGELPADVVDQDDVLFSFRDVRPAAPIHLLVIPKHYVRDASVLLPTDAPLVRAMEHEARRLVRADVGDAYDDKELLLGFHWPPWYSVPWLHLHAIYPRSKMTRRYKYTPFSFYTPERVLRRLER